MWLLLVCTRLSPVCSVSLLCWYLQAVIKGVSELIPFPDILLFNANTQQESRASTGEQARRRADRAADLWAVHTNCIVRRVPAALQECSAFRYIHQYPVQSNPPLRTRCILQGLDFRMSSFITGRFCCNAERFSCFLPATKPLWLAQKYSVSLRVSTKKVLFHYLLNALQYPQNHCHRTQPCFLINEANWSRFWCVSALSYAVCLGKPVKISV